MQAFQSDQVNIHNEIISDNKEGQQFSSSIDKDEEDACQTIEDERLMENEDQTQHINKLRQLKMEIGYFTRQNTRQRRPSQNMNLLNKRDSINSLKRVVLDQHRVSQIKKLHTQTVDHNFFEELKISDKQSEFRNKDLEMLENNTLDLNLNEESIARMYQTQQQNGLKLDLLKQNNKIQRKQQINPAQKNSKPFGYQSKAQTGRKIGQELKQTQLIKQSDNRINQQLQPQNQQTMTRKKSLLYQKPQSIHQRAGSNEINQKQANVKNYKQSAIHIPGLKELTLQASSLFNISIDHIIQTPARDFTQKHNYQTQNQPLFTPTHFDTHQNTSLNTTQQMAQMVSNVLQPSDKSNFQFTPKFFKPNHNQQPGPHSLALSIQHSNVNFGNMLSEVNNLQTEQQEDVNLLFKIEEGNQVDNQYNQNNRERLNSSFERIENEVLGKTPRESQTYDQRSQFARHQKNKSSIVSQISPSHLVINRESPQMKFRTSIEQYQNSNSLNQQIANSGSAQKYYTPKSAYSNISQNATTHFQTQATNSQLLMTQFDKNQPSSSKKDSKALDRQQDAIIQHYS
eukprot:403336420